MTQVLVPISTLGVGTDWTASGAATWHEAIDDGSASHDGDTSYIFTAANNKIAIGLMTPMAYGRPAAGVNGYAITVKNRSPGATGTQFSAQFGTQGDGIFVNHVVSTAGTAYFTYGWSFTAAELDQITDFANPAWRIVCNTTDSGAFRVTRYYAQFEDPVATRKVWWHPTMQWSSVS